VPSIKFHENTSDGSRNDTYGQTDGVIWQSKQTLFATVRTRLNTTRKWHAWRHKKETTCCSIKCS